MFHWSLVFVSGAADDLKGLERNLKRRILKKLDWLVEHFDIIFPIALGGEFRGLYKFRVGDMRIFYKVDYKRQIILVYYIGPRDKAYK